MYNYSILCTTLLKLTQALFYTCIQVGQRIDWLRPLDDYEVEVLNSDVSDSISDWYHCLNAPVLWNGDVYLTNTPTKESKKCKLWKYSTSRDSWSDHVIPCDAKGRHHLDDAQSHALTSYDSKLLLINVSDMWFDPTVSPGVKEWKFGATKSTIKIWEFDATKSVFKPLPDIILPQSKRATYKHVAAASVGKYLIICDKSHFEDTQCCVNIYDGTTWVIRDGPCLHGENSHQLLFHNRSVFLIERFPTISRFSLIYETSLQSLIDNDPDPWLLLKSTIQSSGRFWHHSNCIALETHLSIVSYSPDEVRVLHYSVNSESWQEAGHSQVPSLSSRVQNLLAVRLPDESLMIICSGHEMVTMVYKLKPKSEQYVLSCFTLQSTQTVSIACLHSLSTMKNISNH